MLPRWLQQSEGMASHAYDNFQNFPIKYPIKVSMMHFPSYPIGQNYVTYLGLIQIGLSKLWFTLLGLGESWSSNRLYPLRQVNKIGVLFIREKGYWVGTTMSITISYYMLPLCWASCLYQLIKYFQWLYDLQAVLSSNFRFYSESWSKFSNVTQRVNDRAKI